MWTQCWIDYSNLPKNSQAYAGYFSALYVDGFKKDEVISTAYGELKKAAEGLYGCTPEVELEVPESGIAFIRSEDESLGKEGYRIHVKDNVAFIEAATSAAVIYATFRLLALIRTSALTPDTDITEVPDNPIRMLDHWDNMDGSIERGYSGNSFFFEDNDLVINERTTDYARLIASVGINAVAINNVNVKDAATDLVNDRFIAKVSRLTEIFACYGIKMFLSLNYAMPIEYEPASADPLDPAVREWWKHKMDEIYRAVPGLGGFLVKADSEGRPGPFTYGRNQADGANMLAEAIKPHGGIIIWRCFVYNCQQDWRDLKTDRARAGYDYFSSLDGEFADNVILQIKNGPMDFQPREPVSPLFGGLRKTNQILEVQIAQEYTGHQIDLCYLIPWFKQILAFETYMNNDPESDTTVAGIIGGRARKGSTGGMVAVTNTGNDENWTGNDLAAANLYGFGRLAWDTSLAAEDIAREWTSLTYAGDAEKQTADGERAGDLILRLLMGSWPTYEKYTAPLGIGWMVKVHDHYGPSVEGYEYDRWGTYIRADWEGLGVERGPEGTGFALQYNGPNKEMFSDIEKTPDELILFFHKTKYTHVLHSGKTVIQHIYDTHFEGYDEVLKMQKDWQKLKGLIDERSFANVSERFERQAANAREWCDIVNSYFHRRCGIDDEKGRTIY
ncbi:MAG: alpha-glucuronidase [Lachnospiraceae bacterium]|nr:alpha-glucuronidase [Lachnospiraceae bacterium]